MKRRIDEPDGIVAAIRRRLGERLARSGHEGALVRVETVSDRWPGIACLGSAPARFVLRARAGRAEGWCISPLAVRYAGKLADLVRSPAGCPADRARLLAAANAYLAWTGELETGPRLCVTRGTAVCADRFVERFGSEGEPPCACLVGHHSCLYDALCAVRPVLCLGERSPLTDAPEAVRRCRTVLVGAGGLVQGVWDRIEGSLPPGVRVISYGVGIAGAAQLLGWEHHCPGA